jgi:hypothetical protein
LKEIGGEGNVAKNKQVTKLIAPKTKQVSKELDEDGFTIVQNLRKDIRKRVSRNLYGPQCFIMLVEKKPYTC